MATILSICIYIAFLISLISFLIKALNSLSQMYNESYWKKNNNYMSGYGLIDQASYKLLYSKPVLFLIRLKYILIY